MTLATATDTPNASATATVNATASAGANATANAGANGSASATTTAASIRCAGCADYFPGWGTQNPPQQPGFALFPQGNGVRTLLSCQNTNRWLLRGFGVDTSVALRRVLFPDATANIQRQR